MEEGAVQHTTRETDPLLPQNDSSVVIKPGFAIQQTEPDVDVRQIGEAFDNVPIARRQLGLFSVVFLIFNRVIGTGIYATPSIILHAAGSVGVTLVMWLIGALIAAAGTTVYVELGTGLPRSGGEKNYLEFIYRRPKFLATCVLSVYLLITGSAAANSVVFGEYVIHALGLTPSRYNTRFVAILCLTFCMLAHGASPKAGLRMQNALGVFKLTVLSAIAFSGVCCLMGVPGFQVRDGYEKPRNFEWKKMWEGTGATSANSLVTGLYNVIWSFIGYSNANYALSEVRDPIRTIQRAAPLAMFCVTSVYMFINVAYFAAISKSDILGSRRVIAALFFRNLYGPIAEKTLSVLISLSVLGNLLSGQFSQGRVIQELGREGILPYSSFFASSKPFNSPLAGLFTQYVVSGVLVLAPPPGDAYLFVISLSSYSSALINTFVSFGLLLLYTQSFRELVWNPPFRAPKATIILFFLSNVFLVLVPLIPPTPESRTYEHLPYWLHVFAAYLVSLIGLAYWYIKCIWLPKRYRYSLERNWILQDDGVSRFVFVPVPREANTN